MKQLLPPSASNSDKVYTIIFMNCSSNWHRALKILNLLEFFLPQSPFQPPAFLIAGDSAEKESEIELDFSSYPSGVYILKFASNSRIESHLIVKK